MSEEITRTKELATSELTDPLKVGYLIGIDQNNNTFFEIIGSQPDMVALLGLHKIAELKLQLVLEGQTNTGSALILKTLQSISNHLAASK